MKRIIVVLGVIVGLSIAIHAECSESDLKSFMGFYHESRKEMKNYYRDFYVTSRVVTGAEFRRVSMVIMYISSYVNNLDTIADLITIFHRMNERDRVALTIYFTQCKDRITGYLEVQIQGVNMALNYAENQNFIILGNQLKRKEREIIARLKSLKFN